MKEIALKRLMKNKKARNVRFVDFEEHIGQDLDIANVPGAGEIEENFRVKVYRRKIARIVEKNWQYAKMAFKQHKLAVAVNMLIDRSGKIYGMQVVQSSGDTVFDSVVLNAIERSNPLPKPPKEMVSKVIRLNFKPPRSNGAMANSR